MSQVSLLTKNVNFKDGEKSNPSQKFYKNRQKQQQYLGKH